MKNIKRITTGVLSTLILSSAVVGFAAEGDVYNSSDKSIYGTSRQIIRDKTMRRSVLRNSSMYLYEISGSKYTLDDINKAYAKNKEDYINEIKSNPTIYKPVSGNVTEEDFIVITIE